MGAAEIAVPAQLGGLEDKCRRILRQTQSSPWTRWTDYQLLRPRGELVVRDGAKTIDCAAAW